MADIGDLVQVASTKVGQAPRDGVVTGVIGSLLQVKWSAGEESTFAPQMGSLSVVGRARSGSKRRGSQEGGDADREEGRQADSGQEGGDADREEGRQADSGHEGGDADREEGRQTDSGQKSRSPLRWPRP